MVKYKNMTDEMVLIRKDIRNKKGEVIDYLFYDCKPGDVVDITDVQGKAHNFMKMDVELEPVVDEVEEVTEVVEAPSVEDSTDYEETLKGIKGIGKKTRVDILAQFPFEGLLRTAIKNEEHLPFRNDVVNKLIRVFGE